ncbi:MAG: hypothetical protein QW379_02080 [Thermoplasmata archaeon]
MLPSETGELSELMPGPRRAGSRWSRLFTNPGLPLVGIIVFLIVSVPYLHYILTRPQEREVTGVPPPEPWRLCMDVKKDTIIADRELTIQGDIIVREGASLTLFRCNVTMNGTFYVYGKLRLDCSSFKDFPRKHGFGCDFGGRELVLLTNLTNSKRARLNFIAEYETASGSSTRLDVVSGGHRTEDIWHTSDGPGNVTENCSVDLTPFCGGVTELRFVTSSVRNYYRFHLIEPEVVADQFRTVSSDLIYKKQGNDYQGWHAEWLESPFMVKCEGGEVVLKNCHFQFLNFRGWMVDARGARVCIANSSFDQIKAEGGGWHTPFIHAQSCHVEMSGCKMNNGTGLSADNSVIKVVYSGFHGQYEAIIVTHTHQSLSGALPGRGVRFWNSWSG